MRPKYSSSRNQQPHHHHHHHRSKLSQSNKPFKSGHHASKRSLKGKIKKRISTILFKPKALSSNSVSTTIQTNQTFIDQTLKKKSNSSSNPKSTKLSNQFKRKTKAKQLLLKKQSECQRSKAIYLGPKGIPKLIAFIPLCSDIDLPKALTQFAQAIHSDFQLPASGSCILQTRFKNQRLHLMLPSSTSLPSMLNLASMADYIVFVVSAQVEVDQEKEMMLSALCAQGVPPTYCMVQHLEGIASKKQQLEIRKALTSYMLDWFPNLKRVFALNEPNECLLQLRALTETHPDGIKWRDRYSYLLIEQLNWDPSNSENSSEESNPKGTLAVSGCIRGNPLSPNRLIHVPGFGDYRISKIVPISTRPASSSSSSSIMNIDTPSAIYTPDSDADDLQSLNEEDTRSNEQTWPTEEEMQLGERRAKRKVLRVPKGTSLYQAAWLSASEEEEDDNEHNNENTKERPGNEEEELLMYGMERLELNLPSPTTSDFYFSRKNDSDIELEDSEVLQGIEDEETYEELTLDQVHPLDASLNSQKDQEEHAQYLELKRLEKEKVQNQEHRDTLEDTMHVDGMHLTSLPTQEANEEDEKETDEVDTPQDCLARLRFQKYRGLPSFHTTPWDPNEQLPLLYGRLYRLPHFQATRLRLLKQQTDAPVPVGERVHLFLEHVPLSVYQSLSHSFTRSLASYQLLPFLTSLLPFEHQYAEMHFHLHVRPHQRLMSKQPIVLQVGVRHFFISDPIYSTSGQHRNGCSRYLKRVNARETCTLTVLMPITLLGPVLIYTPDQTQLLATGGILPNQEKRLIIKRILLTGKPYKLHKKVAVIRWMFYTPEDVLWFRQVPLHTKLGRVGHIRESVGTHGYMKCTFDKPLKQHDTIYMPLYKRVFPKHLATLLPSNHSNTAATNTV